MAGMKTEALKPAVIFEVYAPRSETGAGAVVRPAPAPGGDADGQTGPFRQQSPGVHPTKKQSAN